MVEMKSALIKTGEFYFGLIVSMRSILIFTCWNLLPVKFG